jgi:hypothetical protein
MANQLLRIEERLLTPAEVARLDQRRRQGHLYLVIGFQMLLIATFVTLWAGQDATYSPGWTHPMLYWDILLFVMSMVFLAKGVSKRRGLNEFFSY